MLWSGDHLFEGTVETLEMLRSKGEPFRFSSDCFPALERNVHVIQSGKQVVFVTNNSTKSRADYKKKLESMGIPASVVSCSILL